MKNGTPEESTTIAAAGRRWKWIGLAGVLCAAAWLALGLGIVFRVGSGPMFALATLAAATTEGMIWLAALLFGVSVYQARRQVWKRLRSRVRGHQ